MQRVLKPNFAASWDEIGEENQVEETFVLTAMKDIPGVCGGQFINTLFNANIRQQSTAFSMFMYLNARFGSLGIIIQLYYYYRKQFSKQFIFYYCFLFAALSIGIFKNTLCTTINQSDPARFTVIHTTYQ